MGNRYIDLRLGHQESLGDASGDSWVNARSLDYFAAAYQQLTSGNELYLGADIQLPITLDMRNSIFGVMDRQGSTSGKYTIISGAKSNYAYTGLDQETVKYLGKRLTPFNRDNNSDWSVFMGVYASYQALIGFQIYNYDRGFGTNDNKTGLDFIDLKGENVGELIAIGNNATDVIINNISGRDISESLIRIGNNANNITISDFTVHGAGNEEGEARYININEGHSGINIANGCISSAIDGYTQSTINSGTYNQGDGISIEEGGLVKISNVNISGCTDRGIDIKAFAEITDVEIFDCKIGVALWFGGVVTSTYVGNPKTNSVNAAVCFQLKHDTSTFNHCDVDMSGQNYSHSYDKPTHCFSIGDDAHCIINEGNYNLGDNAEFVRPDVGAVITMNKVMVNGVKYSGEKTFTTNDYWNPIDGFD